MSAPIALLISKWIMARQPEIDHISELKCRGYNLTIYSQLCDEEKFHVYLPALFIREYLPFLMQDGLHFQVNG